MRKQTAILSAAALLLGGVATASAATATQQPQSQQQQSQQQQAQQPAASAANGTDTVILSAAQRKAVWDDLSKQASNQSASGFEGQIGTFVPNTVKLEPMPSNVTANNSSLGAYNFAMVNNKLLIVDPSNKVVADVLSSQAQQAQKQQPQNQQSQAQQPAASAAAGQHGTDTVILSAAQRKAVWDDLSKQASNQSASGFEAQTGTFVPNIVKLEPMPSNVRANNSSLGAYSFAMVNNKLLIVDPSNKVVADVLSSQAQQAQEQQPQNQQSQAQYPNNQQIQPNNANQSAQNQPNSEQTISPTTLSRNDVRQVQQALDKNGFQVGRVDGRWGHKTSDAMKQFQQSKKIKANGQLDQKTLSDLGLNGAQFAQQNQSNSR
jgi:hypothetical protein